MTKLTDQPIVEHDSKRFERKVMESLIAEGRNARRAGLPANACPPFKDNDMTINWRNGWRWQNEEMR